MNHNLIFKNANLQFQIIISFYVKIMQKISYMKILQRHACIHTVQKKNFEGGSF